MNKIHKNFLSISGLLFWLGAVVNATEPAKNILYFGNSFIAGRSNRPSLHYLLEKIILADGRTTPYLTGRHPGGKSLADHKKYLADTEPDVVDDIPAGKYWDYVIMQDFSTKPSLALNPTGREESKVDALKIFERVRNHSSNVEAIMYETWARPYRGPDSYAYESTYHDESEMQDDLLEGYEIYRDYINAAYSGTTRLAPCGEGWRLLDWDLKLYNKDYHPGVRGALLNALIAYRTIYFENVSDIDPQNDNIQAIFHDWNLKLDDWEELTEVADRLTIEAPEGVAGYIQVVKTDLIYDEEGGTYPFKLHRTGGKTGRVGVTVTSSNNTAEAGSDYEAISQTVTWNDGEWGKKTINIRIINDLEPEGDNQNFQIQLNHPTGGAQLGNQSKTVVTIDDDETRGSGCLEFTGEFYDEYLRQLF